MKQRKQLHSTVATPYLYDLSPAAHNASNLPASRSTVPCSARAAAGGVASHARAADSQPGVWPSAGLPRAGRAAVEGAAVLVIRCGAGRRAARTGVPAVSASL
jgi:anti-sigma-K factor RskA